MDMTCDRCGAERGRHTFGCRIPRRVAAEATAPIADPSRTAPVVINRHHFKGQRLPQPSMYIGRSRTSRPSPLGNPYTKAEHGEDALGLYRKHMRAKIDAGDVAVLRALNSITPDHSLVCSCAPRPCHGDVVVELWLEHQSKDKP
jgi:hypothetical protein